MKIKCNRNQRFMKKDVEGLLSLMQNGERFGGNPKRSPDQSPHWPAILRGFQNAIIITEVSPSTQVSHSHSHLWFFTQKLNLLKETSTEGREWSRLEEEKNPEKNPKWRGRQYWRRNANGKNIFWARKMKKKMVGKLQIYTAYAIGYR